MSEKVEQERIYIVEDLSTTDFYAFTTIDVAKAYIIHELDALHQFGEFEDDERYIYFMKQLVNDGFVDGYFTIHSIPLIDKLPIKKIEEFEGDF